MMKATVPVLLVLFSAFGQSGLAQDRPTLRATYADAPPVIDGMLDEPVWQTAQAATGFRQFEPREGEAASHRTEVRVVFGDSHIYIGAMLHDDDVGAILPTLGRRDEMNRADWFIVSIDSYFDQRTAYTFGVNAAGVQFDGLRAANVGGGPGGGIRGVDASWDAVWASDVRVTPQGWIAEMRIPYSMLRFSEEEEQTWGIHFTRRIPRLSEESEWPFVPRTERENLVARYGRLEGLRGIKPRRNLQLIPYSVMRLQSLKGDEAGTPVRGGGIEVGGDVKLGIGSGITLDATINPDFGQVESDPAVLNLTAFETFFDERRPFFVEGAQIFAFSVGPGQLLYTRRIGGEAPILGAAKLSGRTAGGTSFGVLGATTGEGLEPERHYGVARLSQQIGSYSSAGAALTAFDAPVGFDPAVSGRRRSLSGGADWDLRLADNLYGIEGFTAFTTRHRSDGEDETGFAGKVWGRKRQGSWAGFLGFDVFSDRFNPNDLGQLRENNFVATLLSIDHEINGGRPFGPFQRASAETFTIQRFAYRDGLDLGIDANLGTRWTLRSLQTVELEAGLRYPFGGYDLYETRGLWPRAQPLTLSVGGEIGTDPRRDWWVEPEVEFMFAEDGGRGYQAGLRGEWNVSQRLSLSGNVEAEWEDGAVAWASNETFVQAGDGWTIGAASGRPAMPGVDDFISFDDRGLLDPLFAGVSPEHGRHFVPVFGARDTRAMDLTLRSTVTFTPALSLQFYGQLFAARGRYDRFQILRDRDTLLPFDAFPKRREFAFSSLTMNTVLRWEYLPGSRLYVVWTHGRESSDRLNPLAPWGPSPYDTPLDEQLSGIWSIFPDNVFLVKLSHTFLY